MYCIGGIALFSGFPALEHEYVCGESLVSELVGVECTALEV